MNGSEYISHALKESGYEWYAWKYILRREYLLANQMRFPVGKKYEDMYLMTRILLNAKYVKCASEIVVNYTLGRPGAITNGGNFQTEIDKMNVVVEDIEYFKTLSVSDEVLVRLTDNVSKLYYSGMIYLYSFKGKDRRKFYSLLKNNKYITGYTVTAPQIHLKRMMSIIGIRGTAMLLYVRMIVNYKRKCG